MVTMPQIGGEPGSVTAAFNRLRGGDRAALTDIVDTVANKLLQSVRGKLLGPVQSVTDPEDIVQDALYSFWWRAEADGVIGRFERDWSPRIRMAPYLENVAPELRPRVADVLLNIDRAQQKGKKPQSAWRVRNRHDVFRILSAIVITKANERIRTVLAQKRGAGAVLGSAALEASEGVPVPDLTPEDEAYFRELCNQLLAALPDPSICDIGRALLFSGEEEARQLMGPDLSTTTLAATLDAVWHIFESVLKRLMDEGSGETEAVRPKTVGAKP